MPVTVVADNPEGSVINKILSCVANADGLEWVLLEECFPSGMNYDVEAGKVTWLRARPSVSIGANEFCPIVEASVKKSNGAVTAKVLKGNAI